MGVVVPGGGEKKMYTAAPATVRLYSLDIVVIKLADCCCCASSEFISFKMCIYVLNLAQ